MPSRSVTCVGYGDPADPKVWSGTPANIVKALAAAGCDVATVNALTPDKLKKLAQLVANVVCYGDRDFRRGPAARAHCAGIARRGVDAAGNAHVLHFSVNHLPLVRLRAGERHYLYLDFTYDVRLGLEGGHEMSRFQRKVDALDRAAYAQIDHFFTISDYIRRNLIDRYGIAPEKITVVGTGLGAGFFNMDVADKDYASGEILFSSKIINMWNLKGGQLLLDAFAIAREKNPALRLSLVGHDDYVRIAEGHPGVSGYGYVSWEELTDLFRRASLFAMPALQEPWGLVYLEALASRTPILGLNRLAFPEISGNGAYGFICPDATPESVAATILDAMAAPDRLAEMGEKGQRYVRENFSWSRTADMMTSVMFSDRAA